MDGLKVTGMGMQYKMPSRQVVLFMGVINIASLKPKRAGEMYQESLELVILLLSKNLQSV